MLHTIQNIEYFIMLEVIEPLWQKFLHKMDSVRNVDEVLAAHKSFTDELAQQGMMHSPELVQAIVKMCKICVKFSQMVLSENITLPSKTFATKVMYIFTSAKYYNIRFHSQFACVAGGEVQQSFLHMLDGISG